MPRGDVASPLDAHDLPQLDDNFDELRLVGHHGVDVLVGTWDLVEHAAVLPALDAFRLLLQVFHCELPFGLSTAHGAARSMGRGLERLRAAATPHDVRARAHAARDDAHLTVAGADGSFASHQHLLAEMRLLGDVVVVAPDFAARVDAHARDDGAKRVGVELHHHLPVQHRVALSPEEVPTVRG